MSAEASLCLPLQVRVYDIMGGVTSVRSVPILASHGAPTAVDLHDALPISPFLAPASEAKEAIAAALEALEPGELSDTLCTIFI